VFLGILTIFGLLTLERHTDQCISIVYRSYRKVRSPQATNEISEWCIAHTVIMVKLQLADSSQKNFESSPRIF